MSERRTGPVRSEAVRLAILESTARLFATRGYDHLTIEGIAADAGVGKQTIYRWWRTKSDLVADCLLQRMLLPTRLEPASTGDVRADLEAWVDTVLELVETPGGEGLLRSLIAAAADNVEIGRRLRAGLTDDDAIAGRLRAGIGEAPNLTPEAPITELSEALVGALVVRALGRVPRTQGDAMRLVDAVIGPR